MRLVINDLANWQEWRRPLRFKGEGARVVELHVLCEKRTKLRIKHGKKHDNVSFAGMLEPGITEVQANLEGDVFVTCESEGEVSFYDPSGRNERRKAIEQVSFTGPMNRVKRDPEMERMFQLMEVRSINRQRQRDADFEAQLKQIADAKAEGSNVNPETGEVAENGGNGEATTGEAAPKPNANSGTTSGGEAEGATGADKGEGTDTATPSATP